MTSEEKDLVWKFRFSLSANKNVTSFVKVKNVDWVVCWWLHVFVVWRRCPSSSSRSTGTCRRKRSRRWRCWVCGRLSTPKMHSSCFPPPSHNPPCASTPCSASHTPTTRFDLAIHVRLTRAFSGKLLTHLRRVGPAFVSAATGASAQVRVSRRVCAGCEWDGQQHFAERTTTRASVSLARPRRCPTKVRLTVISITQYIK